jgi:uncharacterized protein YqeY
MRKAVGNTSAVGQNVSMSVQTALKERIQNDISEALRAGDEMSKSTLRMALAAIKNAEVAGSEAVVLTDEQVVAVLRSEVKKRLESAQIYADAGRQELADKESEEVIILQKYLPAAMDPAALAAIVAEEVAKANEAGQTGPKAMGGIIKAVRDRVGDGADGSAIAAAVKSAVS